jgi:CDP-paratose 2-epimerase
MKVLVTGGCGFIGSHVCDYFKSQGWDVVSYDSMTKYELERTGYAVEGARDFNLNYLKSIGCEMLIKDIRNYNDLHEAAKKCDYIVHTAAQPAVTISCEDPVLDFETNTYGTFNVLEVARQLKIPVASCATIHVYGNKINDDLKEEKTRFVREPAEIDETQRCVEGILTPLHASKRSGDIYLQTYIDTFGVEAASFRLTGLYGPRQFGGEDHGWVANFCIRAVVGWPIVIFGTGKQVRDILYATDVAKAFMAFFNERKPGIYNIGGGSKTSLSLLECIDVIEEIRGVRPDVKFDDERHGDLKYFICNAEKAKKEIKWEAQVSPKEGVSKLIEWIEENKSIFKKR